jgi:hypothetical protein
MAGAQDQRRSQPEGGGPTLAHLDACSLEPQGQLLSYLFIGNIKTNKCSVTSNIEDEASFFLYSFQLYFKESAGVSHEAQQVLLLYGFPDDAELEHLDHVDVLLVGDAISKVTQPVVIIGEVAADAGLPTKCHNIGSVSLQEPVLVTPHLSCDTNTSLCFIYNKCDSFFSSDFSQLFVEVRCSNHIV